MCTFGNAFFSSATPAAVTFVPDSCQRKMMTFGNAFLSCVDAGVRDLSVRQVQRSELGQPFEVFQPRVGDRECPIGTASGVGATL